MQINFRPLGFWVRCSLLLAGLAVGAVALAQSFVATGAAVVTETTGMVRYQVGNQPAQVAARNRAIPAGAVITTEADASAVLAFADGQIIVLGERTRFRIVNYDFRPNALGTSGVFLNLIEGSARLVMGTIGQHDPRLIRFQVGTGTLTGAQDPQGGARGADAGVSVHGALTLLEVSHGRVTLTLPSGQVVLVAAGQGALVQADGSIRQGSIEQVAQQAGQTPVGKQMVSQIDLLESYAFPQRAQQTIISLATPSQVEAATTGTTAGTEGAQTAAGSTTATPGTTEAGAAAPPGPAPTVDVGIDQLPPTGDVTPALNLPPLQTSASGTGAAGGAGGGTPCGASCN